MLFETMQSEILSAFNFRALRSLRIDYCTATFEDERHLCTSPDDFSPLFGESRNLDLDLRKLELNTTKS